MIGLHIRKLSDTTQFVDALVRAFYVPYHNRHGGKGVTPPDGRGYAGGVYNALSLPASDTLRSFVF